MILGVYMIIGMLIITGLVVIIDICWRGRKMNKKENLETKNLDDFVKQYHNVAGGEDLTVLRENNNSSYGKE